MPRTKVQCLKKIFRMLASKDIFTPAKSIKHMRSNFGHSQKRLEKIKGLSSNAAKIASEKDVPSQKHIEKDVFTPNQIKFR